MRHRLEQRGYHAFSVADKERRSDATNSAAPAAWCRTRHAPAGGGAGAVATTKRYFDGEQTVFSGFKLDRGSMNRSSSEPTPRRGGSMGPYTTYGILAKELGAGPEVARDVGQAMANNPVALTIPCHRVLGLAGKSVIFRHRVA